MSPFHRFAASVFCLLVLSWAPSQAINTGLDDATLADMRGYLDFSVSGYKNDPAAQLEMKRGVEMGIRMWQTVLPKLRFHWVDAPGAANLLVKFADYTTDAATQETECPGASFTGCATLGNVLSDGVSKMWFNDAGGEDKFSFTATTFISRQDIFSGYEPVTLPPYK
jgi:hypothetical protein